MIVNVLEIRHGFTHEWSVVGVFTTWTEAQRLATRDYPQNQIRITCHYVD